jgi:hypothetical protein
MFEIPDRLLAPLSKDSETSDLVSYVTAICRAWAAQNPSAA